VFFAGTLLEKSRKICLVTKVANENHSPESKVGTTKKEQLP
jgi:hypothetical protein